MGMIEPVQGGMHGDIVPIAEELEMLVRINENRSANGAQALSLNSTLTWVARAHSQDMIDQDWWGHDSSPGGPFSGATFYERVNDHAGYVRTYISENIAMRSWGIDVDDVMTDWMASQNHSDNILNPDFFEIGIGLLEGEHTGWPSAGLHTAVFGGIFGGGSTSVDLAVTESDIDFDPTTPFEGQLVTISAVIHNLGSTDGYPVLVDFYDGDPLSGGTQIGTTQQIPHILVEGENATANVVWDTTGEAGSHDIYVVVDEDTIIIETSEMNNKAYKTVVVSAAPVPIHLEEGWNLVSFPNIVTDTTLENVLNSISGDYDTVEFYNSSDTLDSWKHYHSAKSPSLNDLDNLDNKMGFWIHVTNPSGTDLMVGGDAPSSPQQVSLNAGWNLVGYPSATTRLRDDALNNLDFGVQIDAIQYYDTATGRIKDLGVGDSMEPGKGYWMYATQNCDWIVNN
jgi:hypothetical protein